MSKHRFYIYGVNSQGEYIRSTCIDNDIIHCIQIYREKYINPLKVEQMGQVCADLHTGIEKIERCDLYVDSQGIN